jgi:hypothetical protein
MTAAERQRRHRRKVRASQRQAEIAATRARNEARFRDPAWLRARTEKDAAGIAEQNRKHEEWLALYGRAPLPDANGEADELARQIDEYLAQAPEITIDDVRAAIDRRFGPP